MIFSLQLRVLLNDPITIGSDQVKQSATAKLLGVTVDSHLKFADHVDMAIHKSRGAVHSLLTLRQHRVNQAMLIMYYLTKFIPICPAWYTYITEECKTKLKRHQSMCLSIVHPNVELYTIRLQLASIDRLNSVMLNLCLRVAHKIRDDSCHP